MIAIPEPQVQNLFTFCASVAYPLDAEGFKVVYFWVRSADDFGATLASHGKTIYGDIANFSQTPPIRGWSEVL